MMIKYITKWKVGSKMSSRVIIIPNRPPIIIRSKTKETKEVVEVNPTPPNNKEEGCTIPALSIVIVMLIFLVFIYKVNVDDGLTSMYLLYIAMSIIVMILAFLS